VGWLLRAYPKNRRFARNRELHFTGKSPKINILPVTENWVLRADFKNQHFARNRGLAFTGRFQKSPFCP